MAEIHGKNGKLTLANAQVTVHNWTLSYVADTPETTDFDDSSGGRSYIVGLKGWSGSYDCFFSTSNTGIPGATGTITLTVSTGTGAYAWSGNVIISGMDIGVPVDGVATQTYSFQGTGALSTA